MTITFFHQGKPLSTVTADDSSYRYRKLSGEDRIQLSFTSPQALTLPVGLSFPWQGQHYRLLAPPVVTKLNSRAFQYSLALGAPVEELRKWRMKHRADGAVKFHLTARPEEHLRMLIDAANAADPGAKDKWSITSALDAPEKLISYDHTDLLSALSLIAKTFETEWIAEGKRITLGKIERNHDAPLPLSYGKDKGLRSGLKRENAADASRLSRLYIQGSERNIPSSYGARRLHLPKATEVAFDGEHFDGEEGFRPTEAFRYRTAPDGAWVERVDDPHTTGAEGSLDATDIYPCRVGEVTAWSVLEGETKDKHPLFAFTDTTLPDALDFSQSVIPGQTLTVIFQTGMLAGQEFEAQYSHRDRRFVLFGKETDGVWMPEAPFLAKPGDKYAVFHVELPTAYIREDKTRTGAEWLLLRRSLGHLHQSHQHPFTYRADVDGLWLKKDWLNRGGKISLGGYVRLSDPELIPDGALLRILAIKDYLISPETPELELGTAPAGSSILTTLEKLRQDDAKQTEATRRAVSTAARSAAQAVDTARLVAEATAERFGQQVSASNVRTMQLLVGDTARQLRLIDAYDWSPEWRSEDKTFFAPSAGFEHQTLGLPEGLLTPNPKGRREWLAEDFTSPALTDPSETYYLYLQADINEDRPDASFYLSRQPMELHDSGFYFFLLGTLSSEDPQGSRSFAPLYGWSEVLPGRITTDRLLSADGKTDIDLRRGTITSPRFAFVYPDGTKHPYPESYLTRAIQDGSTEVRGGLVLASLIGAKDEGGKIASFISGTADKPALAAGAQGIEDGKPEYTSAIMHDGTAHFGGFHITHADALRDEKRAYKQSVLRLENPRYHVNPLVNPWAVTVGGEHPDLSKLQKDTLSETLQIDLGAFKLPQLHGSVDIIPGDSYEGVGSFEREIDRHLYTDQAVERPDAYTHRLTIPRQKLGAYITQSSSLSVKLSLRGVFQHADKGGSLTARISYGGTEFIQPREISALYGSAGADQEKTIEWSFTARPNFDASLPLEIHFAGFRASEASVDISATVTVTTPAFASRGVTLSQSGLSVFYSPSYWLDINLDKLPYLDPVTGVLRRADAKLLRLRGGMEVRGKVDIPGVLLAATVSSSPVKFVRRWGAPEFTVDRPAGWGRYVFRHKLGHTNYVVQATAIGDAGAYCVLTELEADRFAVTVYRHGSPSDSHAFNVLVIGDNAN